MDTFSEYGSVSVVGGLVYGGIEVLYKGSTHWSMLLAGGICSSLIYLITVKSREQLWKKWVMCGAVVTMVEFITGVLVNIIFKQNVWDYSNRPFNLLGQICPLFTLCWIGLSVPAVWMCTQVRREICRRRAQ